MQRKKIPLSLRISDDDAAFLAKYQPHEAMTASDKVRHLLSEARERHDAKAPEQARQAVQHVMSGGKERWQQHEAEQAHQSDLAAKLYERAPALLAILAMGPTSVETLPQFEMNLATETARLLEDILLIHLSETHRSYDETGLKDELSPALTLVTKLMQSNTQGE